MMTRFLLAPLLKMTRSGFPGVVGLILWGACACSVAGPALPNFPLAPNERSVFANAEGGLLTSVWRADGTPGAILILQRDGGTLGISADGTQQWLPTLQPLLEFAALSATRDGRPFVSSFVAARAVPPYAHLSYFEGGAETPISTTGVRPFGSHIGALAAGKSLVVANHQGLGGCSSRPVVLRCSASSCTSRCLAPTNANASVSAIGGTVLVEDKGRLSALHVSSASFDGGTLPLEPEVTSSFDGGVSSFALSPDGSRALTVQGLTGDRLSIIQTESMTERAAVDRPGDCRIVGFRVSTNRVWIVCIGTAGESSLLPISWDGELGRRLSLEHSAEGLFVAMDDERVLVGRPFDGGIELQRVD